MDVREQESVGALVPRRILLRYRHHAVDHPSRRPHTTLVRLPKGHVQLGSVHIRFVPHSVPQQHGIQNKKQNIGQIVGFRLREISVDARNLGSNSFAHPCMRGRDRWTTFCRVLNFALIFETILAFVLIYVPGINSGLQMEMLFPTAWFPCLPFVILGRGPIFQLMSLTLNEILFWWLLARLILSEFSCELENSNIFHSPSSLSLRSS